MDNFFLKTGEFAKICGVKKATIVHYANVGILNPNFIGENGYAYYTPGQIYDFELINILKGMNVPLKEIKDYMINKNGNVNACREILEKKLKELQEHQKVLHSVEVLVQNTIRDIDDLKNQKIGVIEEVTFDEPEIYYIYDMPYRTAEAAYLLRGARDIIKHVQESFLNESINVIEIVMKRDLLNGTFRKTYGGFIAKKGQDYEPEHLFTRPAGTYLTVAEQKGGDRIADIYRELKNYADENGYEICGNGYEKDLLSHIVDRDRSHYLVRCYIQVTPKTNSK